MLGGFVGEIREAAGVALGVDSTEFIASTRANTRLEVRLYET